MRVGHAPQRRMNIEEALGRVDETPLAFQCWLAAKPVIGIERRQQGDGDAGLVCSGNAAKRHFRWFFIGLPSRLVVQIMEFADAGIAGLEHFHIGLRGNGLKVFGRESERKPIHHFAPGPETVRRCA